MAKICIDQTLLFTYSFLLVSIIVIAIYSVYREHFSQVNLYSQLSNEDLVKKINELQNKIMISEQSYQRAMSQKNEDKDTTTKFLEKIYNPLAPPENVYPNRNYDGYKRYQEIGYITGEKGQFPVFARYKYPGKTDRFEYYTISDSRNRIKIPFNIKNFNELYTDDSVNIPELGSFVFKKYPDEGLRYDPNNY